MRVPLYFAGSSLVVRASFLGRLIGWGRRDRSCSAIYNTNETEYRLEFSEKAREFKLDAIAADESIVHMGPSASAKFRVIGLVERDESSTGRGAVGKSPKAACLEAMAAHLDLGHKYAVDEQAREAINNLIDGQLGSAYHSSLPSRPHLSEEPRRRSLPEGSTFGDGRSRDNFTAAILSLDEAPSGGFDLSSLGDVVDGMRGLGGIVGRMTLRDAWNGMQTKKDAECSLARVFNVEPSLQYDYRMTIDKEGNAAASLAIKVLKDGIVEEKFFSFDLPLDEVEEAKAKRGRRRKDDKCFQKLRENLWSLMGRFKKPLREKLMPLISLKVERELTASAASFAEKSGIFVLEGGTLAATVIQEFVADELKRVRESHKVEVVVKRDPEELKDPVLCEASQMGNLHATKRQLGLVDLQLKKDFTIHKIAKFWPGSSKFDGYPEKFKLALSQFFDTSSLAGADLGATDDTTLCRFAIQSHLKAALEYGRAVLIGKREERVDEREGEMKDIVDWEGKELDSGEEHRKSFRVEQGSRMEEGLLAMEEAVTENPDMPCRATWDSDGKRYYFEMYRDDEEVGTTILDVRMITDGVSDAYSLRSFGRLGLYEKARAECFNQWPASSPRESTRKTCLISVTCYLWYAKILAAGSKGKTGKTRTGAKFFEALGQILAAAGGEDSGPIDLGRTPAAYLDGLLPAIHSHALKRVRNDPKLGFVLPTTEPVCRAFSSTPGDREGFTRELALYALSSNRVVLGESHLSEQQLKEHAGKEGPPSYDEEKRLDQLVTIGDPLWDDEWLEAQELNSCQKNLFEYLMQGWTTVRAPALKELGAGQRVRGWMSKFLVGEMKDQNRVWAQRAWIQPVEELPLYKLERSALSVWMMEIMMRSDMTWTTVTTTPKGNVTASEGPPLDVDDHFEAEVSSPSVCGIEVMGKGAAAKKGRRPSMSMSLTREFLLHNIQGPEYDGKGSILLRKFFSRRVSDNIPSSIPDESDQNSLLLALCKGALFEYLTTASARMLDERTFGTGTHARRLEVSALTTKSLVTGTGGVVVFRVHEGSPFGSAVEDMYNLAMDSDRDCSLSRMAERIPFPEPISVLHDITMKSTPSRGVIVSGEPFSLMNSRKSFREDVTTKLMDPDLGEEGVSPLFTCRARLVDILKRAWMSVAGDWSMLRERVSHKIEAEEALDSCSIETVEKRKTGGAVPRFSLSLRSDFSMHRIGLPDGTLGFLEELRPLWRLVPALPRPRMTVVEVCQQTLFDYLRAAQEKLPNSVDRLEEDHYQEMGPAVVTRGSTTFKPSDVVFGISSEVAMQGDTSGLHSLASSLHAWLGVLSPPPAAAAAATASRVTDYECTAQYTNRNNTYWFSFIEVEGSFLLTTAMKDKSLVNLSPQGIVALAKVGETSEALFGRRNSTTTAKSGAPKCIEGVAAYMGLGYLYSTNRGGARVIINNRLLSTSRRSSATEGLGNLDTATTSHRLAQELDDAQGAKLLDAPEGIRTAITPVKRSKSGAFDLSNSLYAEDGVRGIYDVVERVITVDPDNGISSATDTACEVVRRFNIVNQQYDYRLIIDREGRASICLTLRSFRTPSMQSALAGYIVSLMGSYKKPAENKLISLLKARVESELWRATQDLDTALFEMKGDTQVAAVMEEYVAAKLKDTASALGMRPIRRDPSREEPVLCELTLVSTVEKRMGDLELQLNHDFTILRMHRLWAKSQLSEEYPEKMKLILWRFFEPSIPLLKNPRVTTDAELCRMALYHHINAALAYSNTVQGEYYRPLSEERDSQDIVLRAQLDSERSAFYVKEGSHAANALLVMEKAVKERPDMPCRATWDSPEKRYYMELDREAVGGVYGLRMITDGSIDFYPLMKEAYENAAEKCLQQPQGTRPRNSDRETCIFSIACYLWNTRADIPWPYVEPQGGAKPSFAAILALVVNSATLSQQHTLGLGSIDLGVVSSDLLNIVVPWMHSQGLTAMQNNPDAGMMIRELDPVCQAALVTEDRIVRSTRELTLSVLKDNKIVLGESSLTVDQRKRRVAAVKPFIPDKELRLDEMLERVDLKADIGSLEGKKILNTCERRLLEYLMRGWKFVRSEDVKKAGGADHHNLEMRVSEYLLAEYEDPKAWTQPVRDLPVYRLIQSTLAVKIMGSLMRMSNPTWSVVEHPKTSAGIMKAVDDETSLLDSAALVGRLAY
ncbi:hypothetical protein FOZ61_003131 [Perkinsus olseni]|uniref:Uncharacterized protein n=1 Tax=Perkinsus olseni TaxID=32597 RepID=A0A7J6LRA7_PEROL|nr:hypothetical protein FOZ61_003131 [Perkinsus olseni]